jgi:serine/threonine-protein kinase
MNADDHAAPAWGAPPRYPELHSMNLEADGLRQTCLTDLVFLERYSGWEPLGQGRHGTVIKTYCRPNDMHVALKLIPQMAGGDPGRVTDEASTLARITHPCVVRTFAAFCRGPLTWIEMELIEGVTLAREIERRAAENDPWTPERQLAVAWAAAEGLAAIHAAGVVHRDIKPDNILVLASGRPAAKLVDFGVARLRDASAAPGMRGYAPGTPRYSAPELITLGRTSTASDVYAFGVTLYELFAGGAHPYALPADAPVGEFLQGHILKAPVPLRTLVPDLPDDVADLVARALDKRPEQRPSARELADGLRTALPSAREVEVVSALRSERRRERGTRLAIRLATVGVSMLMLMGVMAAWRQWRGGNGTRDTAAVAVTSAPPNLPAPPPLAPRISAPAARLHVSWTAPGVVGVANPGTLDLLDVTVRVADVLYPLGTIAVDEEAWVFAAGEGAVTVEGHAADGTRVVAVLS